VRVALPNESYDFDTPTVFLPLLVCMAPYGAVIFTIAARPAFGEGTVQDWAEYLGEANDLAIERMREARVNRLPCVLVDATMPSDAGLMRSRSVFLEDGRRLYNIGALAPDAIWASVASDFDRLLGSFSLDDVKGITAAPLRLMTSESAVELPGPGLEAPTEDESRPSTKVAAEEPDVDEPIVDDVFVAELAPNDRPTQDPEFAGQPDWWRSAVLLERADRLEDAERAILSAVNHLGAFSSVAHLYEERYARLARAGQHEAAARAKERAIHWLYTYASGATSGGEGTALSHERDQRIAALGGEAPAR
jgi:hypothetical protein